MANERSPAALSRGLNSAALLDRNSPCCRPSSVTPGPSSSPSIKRFIAATHRGRTMRTPSFKPPNLLRTAVLAVLLAGLPISAGGHGLAATQARAQGHGDGGDSGGGRVDSARGSGSSGEAKVGASPQWARSARQLLRRLLTSAPRPPAPIPIAGVVAPSRRAAAQSAGHSRDTATVLISHPPPASHLSPKLVPPQRTLPPIPD